MKLKVCFPSFQKGNRTLNPAVGKQQIDFLKSEIGQDIPPQLLEMLSCFDGEKLSFSGMIGGEWPYINPRTGTEVEKTSYFEPKRPLR